MQGKVSVLSRITNRIMESMEIIGIKHEVTYDVMVKQFDVNSREDIDNICAIGGLEWKVIPFPYSKLLGQSPIRQEIYREERIGARMIFKDPNQTEEVIPSIAEYQLKPDQMQWT